MTIWIEIWKEKKKKVQSGNFSYWLELKKLNNLGTWSLENSRCYSFIYFET